MSKSEDTWAQAIGCVFAGIVILVNLAIAGLIVWGLIELILFLGRN